MSSTSASSRSSHSSLATPTSGSSNPPSILKTPDSPRSDKKVRFSESNDYFIFTTPQNERKRQPKSISPSEYSLKCLLAGQQVLAAPKIPRTRVKSDSLEGSVVDCSYKWDGKEEDCIGDWYGHSGVERARKERERPLGQSTSSRFSSFSMSNVFDNMVEFFAGVKRTGEDKNGSEDMNEYKIITRRRLFRPTTYSIVFNDNARKSV